MAYWPEPRTTPLRRMLRAACSARPPACGSDERGHRAELTDAASGARLLTAASGKTTRRLAAEARAAALVARLRDLEARLGQGGDESEV